MVDLFPEEASVAPENTAGEEQIEKIHNIVREVSKSRGTREGFIVNHFLIMMDIWRQADLLKIDLK